jgi:hypothetical protein
MNITECVDSEKVQDLHLVALKAVMQAMATIREPSKERTAAFVRAFAEGLAAEYCSARGLKYTSDGMAMEAANSAVQALSDWCDREIAQAAGTP